jgi:predicted branched-subunit amino acid permease
MCVVRDQLESQIGAPFGEKKKNMRPWGFTLAFTQLFILDTNVFKNSLKCLFHAINHAFTVFCNSK